MQKITLFLFGLLIVTLSQAQTGQPTQSDQYEKKWFVRGTDTLPYRIMYPLDYKPSKKYPLVLILHGSGERGNDNERQLIHNTKLFSDSAKRAAFPAIVIIPQCSRNDFWARVARAQQKDSLGGIMYASNQPIGPALNLVSQLLDSMVAAKKVNTKKIYVGGLSMGGMGTFEILWRKPGFFAAAFPICGGGDPSKVSLYGKKFPIWVFHGSADNSVTPANSRLMVHALTASGAKVKYTEYPGVGHNSWDNAYAEPELLPWLFKQKK
jgi:predicted peptidase